MSAYGTAQMLPQQNHSHPTNYIPQYPQLPPSPGSTQNAPQAYMNVDPQLNHNAVQQQIQPPSQPQPQTQTSTSLKSKKGDHTSDGKARLRKACDTCSVRKVKCDEAGPPCKACVGLQIPCTYDRPSKRRGPPNRHAESLKRQRFGSDGGSGLSQPSSPTHAAHTLAAFAQQQVPGADAICPMPILHALVQDYFTHIHPLIPLPHKPSFMAALERREDLSAPTFLALLASMVGCLVASFPRRPRKLFQAHNIHHQFPTSMIFVHRCRQVASQAQSSGYPDRPRTIHDAIINYLQGLTSAYTYDRHTTFVYFRQCLSDLVTIGAYKTSNAKLRSDGVPQARMIPNGHVLEGPQQEFDFVDQELRKRTFWVIFAGVRSLQQMGASQWELVIPPATRSQPYPPLPLEVDDEYLTVDRVYPQPSEVISELSGFNANIRVYTSYNDFANIELNHGPDELVDWDRQKLVLEKSIEAVKRVSEGLPTELFLSLQSPQPSFAPQYPSPATGLSGPPELGYYASTGFDNRPIDYHRANEQRRIQHEIQKANIYASQLGTRSYLVEKYWTLYDAHKLQTSSPTTTNNGNASPDISLPQSTSSPSPTTMTSQQMTAEREDIVKSTVRLLNSINQINMEPNGTSFIGKIRLIASTLHRNPHMIKGSLGGMSAEECLDTFLNILTRLEGGEMRGVGPEEDEEAQLRGWADLRAHQERFYQAGGFGPD